MTLSIGEFAEMCQLPPQTLRFYHSQGLLVPARVDGRTGYRAYEFSQIEQAMLITTLRRAGLSVRQVREALDDGDAAPDLLAGHREALQRRRREEDEALDDAQVFTTVWPEVRERRTPSTTAVSTLVAGATDPDMVSARVAAAALALTRAAESCGATVTGVPWKTYALDTREQKELIWSAEGPQWTVAVPVGVDGRSLDPLPQGVTVGTFAARDEISIVLPGRETTAKYATALNRLVTYAVDQTRGVDVGRPRHLLHDGCVEIAVAVWDIDEDDLSGSA